MGKAEEARSARASVYVNSNQTAVRAYPLGAGALSRRMGDYSNATWRRLVGYDNTTFWKT